MKTIIAIFALALISGCANMTPAQKRVVKRVAITVAIGSAAAMVAAHRGSSEPEHQFPCGCTPPPRVQ